MIEVFRGEEMETLLLRHTADDILNFVQESMLDHRWTPGYERDDIFRYERAKHLANIASMLINESDYAERMRRDARPMRAALTASVLELAELAREAVQNRTLRANQLDCYAIFNPLEADAEHRRHDTLLAA
jgi:hypothetical protein